MKKSINAIVLLVAVVLSISMSSCGKKIFLITSGTENLRSLTKITDGDDQGLMVGGDYASSEILLVIKQGDFTNIYRKDNPVSPSMVQMTSGNNHNWDPTLNVDIDRIAFSRYPIGAKTRDIYMIPAVQGSTLIPVTESTDANEFSPSFTPDGKFICYEKSLGTRNNINAEIWIKNIKTGETSLLGKGFSPKLSPDGKRIVFVKAPNINESQIWVMNLDGTNAKQLTSGAKKEFVNWPCWSPDGKRIAFQSYVGSQKKDFDIYVINDDGTGLMQLTTNESDDLNPYWSKDNFIYFSSDRGGRKGHYQIWRFQF